MSNVVQAGSLSVLHLQFHARPGTGSLTWRIPHRPQGGSGVQREPRPRDDTAGRLVISAPRCGNKEKMISPKAQNLASPPSYSISQALQDASSNVGEGHGAPR